MKLLSVCALLLLCLALLLGGTAPFGRLLMSAGLPGLAVPFFSDPGWRGAAQFRAGRMDAAAEEFRRARAVYNLGNAETHRGNYAAALEAYDLGIAAGDDAALANFDVVAAFYAGLGIDPEALALYGDRKDGAQADSFIAQGNARAAGTGDAVTNANTMLGLAQLDSRGQQGVRRIFDDKFMVADERWLEQLSDVPGDYLGARIGMEYKRRVKLGLSPPEPEDRQ